MIEDVRKRLEEYEELVKANTITSFKVCIRPDGMLLTTDDDAALSALVPLSGELLQSLQMFFFEADSIGYGTADYTSLVSILHAKAALERILQKPQTSVS